MVSAATAPDLIINPLSADARCYRAFAADTASVAWLRALGRLLTLENYNGLTLQAAQRPYETAREYLESVSNGLNLAELPLPEFTPDGDGGIEIDWERKGRRLVASFKALEEDTDFISWREPQGRYDGREADKALLKSRLEWLMS